MDETPFLAKIGTQRGFMAILMALGFQVNTHNEARVVLPWPQDDTRAQQATLQTITAAWQLVKSITATHAAMSRRGNSTVDCFNAPGTPTTTLLSPCTSGG